MDLQPSPPTLSHRPPTTHQPAEQPARVLQLGREDGAWAADAEPAAAVAAERDLDVLAVGGQLLVVEEPDERWLALEGDRARPLRHRVHREEGPPLPVRAVGRRLRVAGIDERDLAP